VILDTSAQVAMLVRETDATDATDATDLPLA